MLNLSLQTIIAFVGGLVILCIILKLLSFSFKTLFGLVFNALLGGAILYLINTYGASILGFTLEINWLSALLVGFFGIPGVILVAILQLFIL